MKHTFKILVSCVLAISATQPVHAIWGIGDTVIVAADPANAVKWASQASQMAQQIRQMTTMVQNANTIISYAGNPKDAIKSFSDLSRVSAAMANIVGPGATAEELMQASAFFRDVGAAQEATEDLMRSIDGLSGEVGVFGTKQKRHKDFYAALTATEQLSMQTRQYLKKTAEQRKLLQEKLEDTWNKLKSPGIDESQKRNLMAQISQLQAEILLLENQQNATVTDLQLETSKRIRQQQMKNVGNAEQAQLEGDYMAASLTDRKQKVSAVQEAALATERQESPDWSKAIRTYWAPPANADTAGLTR